MSGVKLTDAEARILRSLPVTVYTPGLHTMMKYGPLAEKGLLSDRDIGSDEAQETILEIYITPSGLQALGGSNAPSE